MSSPQPASPTPSEARQPAGPGAPAEPIRVLLVDDHPLVRDGLIARLENVSDITVVGEAGQAAEALAQLAACRPQVVLMDIGMRETGGIELTAMLLEREPSLIVLMLTMHDGTEYVQRALAAGARGYVLKDSPSSEIVAAIRTVSAGGTFLSPVLAQRLFRLPAARVALSEREQQILVLLGQGQSSKQIARTLDIGVRTVETHRQNIRRKLDLAGQAELIRYAVEHTGVRGSGPGG
ncbi:response regulator [Leptothrix discophora]|uniref:Response regulator transcription factor n=1 Tax=Leptothrix discophora TaxID=89 RepID=A0ABT9G6A1_LEPDI|nr:response regulator transcription factor [Leptothrix discophora]MDP4302015.1 response regulator transcription factor [Leptothrix discophora]